MPAGSKAQYKKMFVLYRQGKITRRELDEYTRGVSYKSLPRRKTKRKKR